MMQLASGSMVAIPKRNGRNGFLSTNMSHKSLFGSAAQFANMWQLKGWQPHFQPTVAKGSTSTSVRWFAAVS